MKLWFASDENVYTVEIVFKIETAKSDLRQAEYELKKAYERKNAILTALNLLKKNLDFLKDSAEIISIKEYKKSIYQIVSLQHEHLETLKQIFSYKKDVKNIEKNIKDLELKKEQVKFKVLEFKKK